MLLKGVPMNAVMDVHSVYRGKSVNVFIAIGRSG